MREDKLTTTEKTEVARSAADMLKPKIGMGLSAKRKAIANKLAEVNPEECLHRLGIVFDDSGSMSGQAINDAHSAVTNFLTTCSALETSVAIYPMNAEAKPLTNDYQLITMYINGVYATGGTPLYRTLRRMLKEQKLTRAIVFSDGCPNQEDQLYERADTIAVAKAQETPIDTIFIGMKDAVGYDEMKKLAEDTGGIFVWFEDSTSLSRSLKYLSPGLRGLLTNPEVKNRIEKGEQI